MCIKQAIWIMRSLLVPHSSDRPKKSPNSWGLRILIVAKIRVLLKLLCYFPKRVISERIHLAICIRLLLMTGACFVRSFCRMGHKEKIFLEKPSAKILGPDAVVIMRNTLNFRSVSLMGHMLQYAMWYSVGHSVRLTSLQPSATLLFVKENWEIVALSNSVVRQNYRTNYYFIECTLFKVCVGCVWS